MRSYARFFLTTGCEAPGCSARVCSLHPVRGNYVRACTGQHAILADAELTQRGTTARHPVTRETDR